MVARALRRVRVLVRMVLAQVQAPVWGVAVAQAAVPAQVQARVLMVPRVLVRAPVPVMEVQVRVLVVVLCRVIHPPVPVLGLAQVQAWVRLVHRLGLAVPMMVSVRVQVRERVIV